MLIRLNGRRYRTKRHTRAVGSEIEARGLAAKLSRLDAVLRDTIHYHRSDVDRFQVVWNTKEKRGRDREKKDR